MNHQKYFNFKRKRRIIKLLNIEDKLLLNSKQQEQNLTVIN